MRIIFLLAMTFTLCVDSCASEHLQIPKFTGDWLITITTRDVGKIQMVMNWEVDKTYSPDSITFDAYTEKDVDKKILGNIKARLGRVAGSNFKNGSLIRIANGYLSKGKIVHGVLVTPFGNYYFDTHFTDGHMIGTLSDGSGQLAGSVEGVHGRPKLPLHNYPEIASNALALAERKLYDPSLLKRNEWREFRQEITRVSKFTSDDAAFVMAFFYYARKLPFTHFALFSPGNTDTNKIATVNDDIIIVEKPHQTCYMKIKSFGGKAADMDKAFEDIAVKNYKNLVVDLRGNSGGSIEMGMAFGRHILRDSLYIGVLLTQKYFASRTTLPNQKDFDHFLSFSAANYGLLIQGISEYPGICLKGYSAPPIFTGTIYILTDERTASTCEPIVYALKQNRLATIVGNKTAGAMLNGEQFTVGANYMLTVPTATYYTADGFKIDKKGVEPNISLNGKDALDFVINKIATESTND